MRGLSAIGNLSQDFRYTIRQLRKNPGFATAAIIVLALGIAGAVMIFGFVDAALIQPLPYRDPSRLVAVFESSPHNARSIVSYLDLTDWKTFNTVFNSIDAYALNGGFTLTDAKSAERVTGTRVSPGFFRTLGVTPTLGRDFSAAPNTVILSYAAWQKRFGGRPDVLGSAVTLNGARSTIIGVLPPDFHFAPYGGAEFWGTLRSSDPCERVRGCHNLNTIARLKDGVSIGTASADMRSIAEQLRRQYPDSNRDFGSANLTPLSEVIVGDVRPILLVLLSGAGLLLLIACVNVTTLLLARSDKRQREISVRAALGASSSRLFLQFAAEGFALAAAGGFFGLVLAAWGMHFLVGLIPAGKIEHTPYLQGLGLNLPAIVFTCCISLLSGALFSLVPIGRMSLSRMIEGLKESARGSAGTTWRRLGSKLVIAEVAIAMVLMVGGGLLGKSLYLLLHLDVGFNPDRLAVLETAWSRGRYETDPQKIALARRVLDRISRLPGVKSVAVSLTPPVGSVWGTTSFHVLGQPNQGENNEVLHRPVSSGYFATIEARLLRGRYFREGENASQPLVAIVNRAFASKYFRGENIIGKQIYYDFQPQLPIQIVGVVDDIKEGPLEGVALPVLYVPFEQKPVDWFAVLVRTSQAEASVLPDMAAAIHGIDPFISISGGGTMTEKINQSPSAYLHRSAAWLVGTFAAAAFLLSVVGLYGVIAYSVAQRTREIGVRMALGAERGAVYRLILREAGNLAASGVVLGLVGSLAAANLLRSLLFGVRSWDVQTLFGVATVLAIASLLASYIPARRAASVNPVEALRAE
jgi:predicted permease